MSAYKSFQYFSHITLLIGLLITTLIAVFANYSTIIFILIYLQQTYSSFN